MSTYLCLQGIGDKLLAIFQCHTTQSNSTYCVLCTVSWGIIIICGSIPASTAITIIIVAPVVQATPVPVKVIVGAPAGKNVDGDEQKEEAAAEIFFFYPRRVVRGGVAHPCAVMADGSFAKVIGSLSAFLLLLQV